MIVARPLRVANSKRHPVKKRKANAPKRHRPRSGNPAFLMTLGPMNPKRRTMAKKKKNRASGRGHHHARAHNRRSHNAKRRTQMVPLSTALRMAGKHPHHSKHHKARRAHNPFGTNISIRRPVEIVTAAAGVLVGVAATKFIVGMLPTTITSNTLYATLAGFAAAGLEWWVLSFVSPEFGAAAGLGGIAEAGSIALTNFMPSVGSSLALSGRGAGDFVPGRFSVPQNPVLDAATGMPKHVASAVSAYPRAYATAA
jgi:hypothetical protein